MIGRIYKVEVNKDNIYIGSTINPLKQRQINHNYRLRENVNKCKLYEECRKNNITKISLILIEEREIKDFDEIRELENKYIKELQPILNERSAYTGLTPEEYNKEYHKEWYINNKEYHKECHKEWYDKNKDKISERQGEKIKCPICNSIVSRRNIAQHKKTIKCRSSIECFIQDE